MKKFKLILSDQAIEDLTEIWLFIGNDSPQASDRFIDFIYDQCLPLCSKHEMGRRRDELIPGLRSFPVKRNMVYYRIREQFIEIIRILNGYRDVDSIF